MQQQRLQRTQAQAAADLQWPEIAGGGNKPSSIEDIFYQLLRNGKVEEALCVFRAHAPFNEFDSERIPSLLSRALPHARKHRLISFMAFQSLLTFLEEEIAHTLSTDSTALLAELAETQTNEILLRILPDEYETPITNAKQVEITQTLQLSVHIARCGQLPTLQKMVQEILDLFEQFQLLRPARILYCLDDMPQNQSCVVRRFEMDCEAFLWRIVDAHMAENSAKEHLLLQQAQQWCCKGNLEWENCVVNFLTAHPALLAEQPLCVLRLVDLLQANEQLRTKAVALCISRFTAPFPARFWEMLQRGDSAAWEKEMKQMRIREICAKYVSSGAFDVAKHLQQMQHHICSLAASAMDSAQFLVYMQDLWAISAQYERARLALLVLQFASHNLALEDEVDRVERIKHVLQSLDGLEEKLHVCQEAIQYMLACCEDDEEEEVDRVLTAHWGRTLCHFVSADILTASITSSSSTASHLLYLDLPSSEEIFREATEALLLLDSSMMSENCSSALPQQQPDYALAESLLCETTTTSEALDAVNDSILIYELRTCCEKSLTKQNIPQGRFRDCPNVLEGNTLVPAVELALEIKRRGGSTRRLLLGKRPTTTAPELESFAAMLFREGAYQLALRFKTHISLHFPTVVTAEEVKIDYMLTTLLRNALDEQQMDECLILGYLLSVTKRDTVVNTLNIQIKRFRYDEEDYSRFERLCWMGKLVADTWKDTGLQAHYSSNEAVFYWFKRLSQLKVQFDRVKLFEFAPKEVQAVAVQLFCALFNFTEFQPQAVAELRSFLHSFRVDDEAKRKQAVTHCLLQVLLDDDNAVGLQPNSSAVVWKWCESACDLTLLLPELNRMTLDVRRTIRMVKTRLALDILVEAEQDNAEYVSRLLVIELFDSVLGGFARVLNNAVEETYKLRCAFQSFTEAELVSLVCTGLVLDRFDFVRKYTQYQITRDVFDIDEVISVIDSIGNGRDEAEFKLQLALVLVERCESCHDQLELVRFAHTMFPARNELQLQMEQLECRCIFKDFGLSVPVGTSPEQLLRVFYERYNPVVNEQQQLQHRMFSSALTLMRGNLRDWTKTLQRCLVDWLQASSAEFDSVAVIVRALQHLQREAQVDAQQFLTGIAFMNSTRIKKIAIVRALKALREFRELTIAEQDLLWMKETEVEMKECAIWKQTIEQVVQTENKPASVRGLLREISQTCLSPEREVKGLQFIAKLIVDFSLYSTEDGVLETCLAQLVQVNALACLQVMLQIPAQHLQGVKDLSIWIALREHTSESKFVILLERCPFDEFVVESCDRMLLQQRDSASSSRIEMLKRRF